MQTLDNIGAVLTEYSAQVPLTIRQIFYRLVAKYLYEKTEKAYENLAELLSRAPRARWSHDGTSLFDLIRDDGFVKRESVFFDDAADFFQSTTIWAEEFRLDRQAGQERRLVVWCEAAGMVPQLALVADPFGIPTYSSGGFDSLTDKRNIPNEWAELGVPITVLHIGDQDPSGVSMMLALAEDLIAFGGSVVDIEIVRIAILPEQAAHLKSAPPKTTDKRRYDQMLVRARTGYDHEFIKIDPDKTWQAEALDRQSLPISCAVKSSSGSMMTSTSNRSMTRSKYGRT